MNYPEDFINKIINADSFKILPTIPDQSIDLIITDPPYNIGDTNKRTKVGNKIVSNMEAWGKWDNYGKQEFDEMIFTLLKESYRILKDGGVMYMFSAREDNGFFIRKAVELGFNYLNQLAIYKKNPLPHFTKTNWRSAFELCMYVSKGKPKTFNFLGQDRMINVYPYLIGIKDTGHPTEKPLEFIQKLVLTSSNEGDVVLDPFLGSGTTVKACSDLKRKYIGIELEPKYIAMAEDRLKQQVLNF